MVTYSNIIINNRNQIQVQICHILWLAYFSFSISFSDHR